MKKLRGFLSLRHFITAMAIFILLATGNRIIHPLYLRGLDQDVELRICATGEQSEQALANNVRIRNILVNGSEINLGKIPKEDGWEYQSTDDFIYVYNLKKPAELILEFGDVHTLELTCIGEVGSGEIQIFINGQEWLNEDLYRNAEWEVLTWRYDSSIWVFPESSTVLLVLAAVLSYLLSCILLFAWKKKDASVIDRQAQLVILHFALSLVILFFVQVIQYQSLEGAWQYLNQQPEAFVKALVLLFIIIEVLFFALRRSWGAYSVLIVVLFLLSVVNLVKLENRGVPLLPWDFSMMGEALSVKSTYRFQLAGIILAVIGAAAVLAGILIIFRKREHIGKTGRILGLVISLGALAFYMKVGFLDGGVAPADAEYRTYKVSDYYARRGFVTGFLEYLVYLKPAAVPEGYNQDAMEEIVRELGDGEKSAVDEEKRPNIIAVMSESFWDISKLDSVEFQEEPLPVYEKLKGESMYGELFAHVFGGGTVVSEFEFLTGFSGEFFPSDYMVYGNFLESGFDSAVSILENQDYNTLAIHPYISGNYNREHAYRNFGFDQCIFQDDFEEDSKLVRNYISDEALYDRVIEEYSVLKEESSKPLFLFAVTMQNHGGYWGSSFYEEGAVKFGTDAYKSTTLESIEDYVAGLHEADRALGELVDYFRGVEEETIIIYFGDHVSDAGPKDEKMLEKVSWGEKDTLEYDYESHIVPYLVWSNYQNESVDGGLMGIGELLPTVLEEYEIEKTLFWDYLVELKEEYAAADHLLVVEEYGKYEDISAMTARQKEHYNKYQLLQYDYIWGGRYAKDLWRME